MSRIILLGNPVFTGNPPLIAEVYVGIAGCNFLIEYTRFRVLLMFLSTVRSRPPPAPFLILDPFCDILYDIV